MRKLILLGIFVLLVGIQFIRPAKNLGSADGPQALTAQHPPAPEVQTLLQNACYDCHSNSTRYPWYAEVQPIGWWLADHVNEGKRHLNFSEFAAYAPQRAKRKLNAAAEDVREHDMPLWSYRLIHRDARLSDDQIKALTDWLASVNNAIPEPKPKP